MKQTPASVRLIDRAGHSAMSCRLHSSELFFGAQSFATASVPSSQCSARGCQSCSLGDDPIWCTHLDRRWSPVIECQCEKSFTAHILPPRPECSSYSSCSLCSISARRPNTVPPSPLAASALLSGAVVGKVSPTSTAALASKMRYRVCEIAALLQRAAGRHSCPGSRSLSGPLLAPASLSRGYLQTPRLNCLALSYHMQSAKLQTAVRSRWTTLPFNHAVVSARYFSDHQSAAYDLLTMTMIDHHWASRW